MLISINYFIQYLELAVTKLEVMEKLISFTTLSTQCSVSISYYFYKYINNFVVKYHIWLNITRCIIDYSS